VYSTNCHTLNKEVYDYPDFDLYPRAAMLAEVFATEACPSVCHTPCIASK